MIISERTKMSLCQLLDLFDHGALQVLLNKHNIVCKYGYDQHELSISVRDAQDSSIKNLIEEMVRTKRTLRNTVEPRYKFDERWHEFCSCLLLDGFEVKEKQILRVTPVIDSITHMEDELTKTLSNFDLIVSDEIIKHIKKSEQYFKDSKPDYNACLLHSRIALETLVCGIATRIEESTNKNSPNRWGRSLQYLSTEGYLSKKEETAISSVYTFVSNGVHKSAGFTEKEFARFGRNLAMSMCYFVLKKTQEM